MMATAFAYALIRRPPADVLSAFMEPDMLERFWLKRASGPLVRDSWVTWSFMAPGVESLARMKLYEPGGRLVIEFPENEIADIRVEPRADGSTFIEIRNPIDPARVQDVNAALVDATSGYTIVLCNLKVLLETGASGNLVEDQALLIQDGKPTA